ncbi:MAG TPA: hypothetical protein DD473_00215 [Planctomycetaceae bacterium]|nr:hypothetical protein [Planctomycetaceae bacterium]
MFQVFEINSLKELETYRLSWQELWGRGRQRRFQMTYEWLEAYWQSAPADRELKVLIAALGGKVIGILPLVIKTVETRLGAVRVLTYPLDGGGNWYGPIGPNSAATLAAGLRYLSSNRNGWDLLDLTYTDRDRIDLGRSCTALRNIGWKPVERIWKLIPAVAFSGSWQEFMGRKRKDVRNEIEQAEAACRSRGTVSFKQYRSVNATADRGDSLEELLDQLEVLCVDGAELKTLRRQCLSADHQQMLELGMMFINGKPVAAAISYRNESGLEVAHIVHNEEPGVETFQLLSGLLGNVLESACHSETEEVEISPTQSELVTAARLWSNRELRSYRYSSCPLTHVKGSLLLNYHAFRSPKLVYQKPIVQTTNRSFKNSSSQRSPVAQRSPVTIEKQSSVPQLRIVREFMD